MDNVQIAHWKEFTRMLCFHARPQATDARKKKLWAEAEEFIDYHAEDEITSWDDGPTYVCDCFSDHFGNYERTVWSDNSDWYKDNPRYFYNHLRLAIRAGVDAATGHGGGVWGFTVGDIRQMFNGEIPQWFAEQFEGNLDTAHDDAGIWL